MTSITSGSEMSSEVPRLSFNFFFLFFSLYTLVPYDKRYNLLKYNVMLKKRNNHRVYK